MKQSFKPLALAAAVSAISAGAVNAQSVSVAGTYPSLGDFAMVPYYTVQGDWVTGIHITNTSSVFTQVVKFRMRGAEDSQDILDFNLVLSPNDVWTGTIRGNDEAMEVATADKSCTAPVFLNDGTIAPVSSATLEGAQEGYVEIIGMGMALVTSPIGRASLHSDGVPANCDAVRTNFLATNVLTNDVTVQQGGLLLSGSNTYLPTGNMLKVSYFIRDNASGIEFGNNAVHITGFSNDAYMTNQQLGLDDFAESGAAALSGYDYPDVRGGGLNTGDISTRNRYQAVVRPALGADSVMNDWSFNSNTGAATDWVVTFPGQYAQTDHWGALVNRTWDYRELPAKADFNRLYDREEGEGVPGGLVFSPSPAPGAAFLPNEVNVISWGPESVAPVLDSAFVLPVDPGEAGLTGATGWAALSVTGSAKLSVSLLNPQPVPWSVCDEAGGPVGLGGAGICSAVTGPIPMVGFAAWERTFDDPDKNYGRIVEHSFTRSIALPN